MVDNNAPNGPSVLKLSSFIIYTLTEDVPLSASAAIAATTAPANPMTTACPNCFVIDNELIYHCNDCVKVKQLQMEEQDATHHHHGDPIVVSSDGPTLDGTNPVAIPPNMPADQVAVFSSNASDPVSAFAAARRALSASQGFEDAPTLKKPRTVVVNYNHMLSPVPVDMPIPVETRPEQGTDVHQRAAMHRRTLTYKPLTLEEQIDKTLEFVAQRGFADLTSVLLSVREKGCYFPRGSAPLDNSNTSSSMVSSTSSTTSSTSESGSDIPTSPNISMDALALVAPPIMLPNILTPPPSELLPGYYIYNKAIDSDTEQKEKVWIQIELPRDIVMDATGKYQTVSLGMEMGPLPHNPNAFLELNPEHLQGAEGSLITETLTHCTYVFDRLRIPNRALISEVLNTQYEGLRAGRFVFKVGDTVLSNKSSRFMIKAPSGNRIRSVNNKAKKNTSSNRRAPPSSSYSSSLRSASGSAQPRYYADD